MAGGIFISYRREDSQHPAGRLADRLGQRFGKHRIFMDVYGIELGLDFLKVISAKLEESVALLVVIGPGWVKAISSDRRRRLDDPDDVVRLEIEAGLKREDVRVIPVLVDGAPMPSSADLPPSLQGLVRRQSVRLTHDAFGTDADRLIATLERLPGLAGSGAPQGKGPASPAQLEFSAEQLVRFLEVVAPMFGSEVYRWPSIPREKEKNARAAANVPPDEEIAALVDLTAFGSAKHALLLGKRGLYYHSPRNMPATTRLSYQQLSENQIFTKWAVTGRGWFLIAWGAALVWTVVAPAVAFFAFLIGGVAGSTLTIGPMKIFVRHNCSRQVFALLHALKAQIAHRAA
jgi:TIR domain